MLTVASHPLKFATFVRRYTFREQKLRQAPQKLCFLMMWCTQHLGKNNPNILPAQSRQSEVVAAPLAMHVNGDVQFVRSCDAVVASKKVIQPPDDVAGV